MSNILIALLLLAKQPLLTVTETEVFVDFEKAGDGASMHIAAMGGGETEIRRKSKRMKLAQPPPEAAWQLTPDRGMQSNHPLLRPPAEPQSLADAVPADILFTIHMTNKKTINLPKNVSDWINSWRHQGFRVELVDDEGCRADIVRLSKLLNRSDYLKTYDSLETPVMRADFWRYARLYLEGGIYADIDVVAKSAIRPLLQRFFCDKCSRIGDEIVFVESDWFAEGIIATFALWLRMTDMVRLPQYRQCILVAGRQRHPLYKLTIDMIVASFADGSWRTKKGLARTLLLTGPGIFTDAVDRYREAHAHINIKFVSRHDGIMHYEHVGAGSWKPKKGVFLKEMPGMASVSITASIIFFVLPSLELGRNRRLRTRLYLSCCGGRICKPFFELTRTNRKTRRLQPHLT